VEASFAKRRNTMCIKTSESISKISSALIKAQQEIKVAIYDATNPHFRSKYASLGSVVEACKEALNKNKIVFIQGSHSDKELPKMICVTTRLLHESGEYIEDTIAVPYVQDTPQALGSSLTYARRYGLSSLLGIVSDEDDDGNSGSVEAPKPLDPPKPKKPTKNELQKKLGNLALKAGCKTLEDFTVLMKGLIGRDVKKSNELTDEELDKAIEALEAEYGK
jgi:hypothetical protein